VTIRGFSLDSPSRVLRSRNPLPTPASQLAMASSLRLPAGSIFLNARPTSLIAHSFASGSRQQQCRSFSAAAQRWAYRTQNFKPSSPAQPSMKSRAKDVMKSQLPNDIGLLPGTFVKPMWRDLPSIFQDPRDRFRMEWTWIKSVFQGYARWVCILLSWTISLAVSSVVETRDSAIGDTRMSMRCMVR
jgi:hypothetical protein